MKHRWPLAKACQRLRDTSDTEVNVPALPLDGERMNLDFSSVNFRPVTMEERISKCRAIAEESRMLANCGSGETQQSYLLLAKCWTKRAEELERRFS